MQTFNNAIAEAPEAHKTGAAQAPKRLSELNTLMKRRLAEAMEIQMLSDRRLFIIRRRLARHAENLFAHHQGQFAG